MREEYTGLGFNSQWEKGREKRKKKEDKGRKGEKGDRENTVTLK